MSAPNSLIDIIRTLSTYGYSHLVWDTQISLYARKNGTYIGYGKEDFLSTCPIQTDFKRLAKMLEGMGPFTISLGKVEKFEKILVTDHHEGWRMTNYGPASDFDCDI